MNSEEKILFFLALIPPEDKLAKYQVLKDHFTSTFGTKAAQKSPPHITLVPPFPIEKGEYKKLESAVRLAVEKIPPFKIEVNGYGRFDSRVIYAHPYLSKELASCRKIINSHFEMVFPNALKLPSRPFKPHITLAFKDIEEEDIEAAWESLKNLPLEDKFDALNVTILEFSNGKWQPRETIPFKG